MFFGAFFIPRSVKARIEGVEAVARGHLPGGSLTPPVENVVREGVGREPRDQADTRNNSRERTGQTNWPDDRHLRYGYHQPNQVHRHNQHTHGTGESVGSFAFTRSVEPLHNKEEEDREETDQEEQVSAEDVSHFTAHAPIEPDSRATGRERA